VADNFSQIAADNNPNPNIQPSTSGGNNNQQSAFDASLNNTSPVASRSDVSSAFLPVGQKASYTPPANLQGLTTEHPAPVSSQSLAASSDNLQSVNPPTTGNSPETFVQDDKTVAASTDNSSSSLNAYFDNSSSQSEQPSVGSPSENTTGISSSSSFNQDTAAQSPQAANLPASEDINVSSTSTMEDTSPTLPQTGTVTPTASDNNLSSYPTFSSTMNLEGSPLSEPIPKTSKGQKSVSFSKQPAGNISTQENLSSFSQELPSETSSAFLGSTGAPETSFQTPTIIQTTAGSPQTPQQDGAGSSSTLEQQVTSTPEKPFVSLSTDNSYTSAVSTQNNLSNLSSGGQASEISEEMPPVIFPPSSSVRPVATEEAQSVPSSQQATSTSGIQGESTPVLSSVQTTTVTNTPTNREANTVPNSSLIINKKSPAVGDAILPASQPLGGQGATFSSPPQTVATKTSSGGGWLVALLLILLLLGGGGYYAYTAGYLDSLLAALPFSQEEPVEEEMAPSSTALTTPTTESEVKKSENLQTNIRVTTSPTSPSITATKPAAALSTPAGRDERRKQDIDEIAEALDKYAKEHQGKVPKTSGPVNLSTNPEVLASVLVPKYLLSLPKDPGSNYYSYESNGSTFTLTAILEVATDPEGEKVGDKTIYKAEGPILENISSSAEQ